MNQKEQIKTLEDSLENVLNTSKEFYSKMKTTYLIMLNKYSSLQKDKNSFSFDYESICSNAINEMNFILCMYDEFDESFDDLPF